MEDAIFDMDAVLKDDILIDALSTLVDADDVVFDENVIFEERFHPTPSDFYLPELLSILLVIREAASTYLVPFVVPVCRRRPAYYT
jgi:hypothetical protein